MLKPRNVEKPKQEYGALSWSSEAAVCRAMTQIFSKACRHIGTILVQPSGNLGIKVLADQSAFCENLFIILHQFRSPASLHDPPINVGRGAMETQSYEILRHSVVRPLSTFKGRYLVSPQVGSNANIDYWVRF